MDEWIMQEFDLLIIGSGSDLDVANAAAKSGLRVAIIEEGRMGGTCLNHGCVFLPNCLYTVLIRLC
jgi:mycothione reductase